MTSEIVPTRKASPHTVDSRRLSSWKWRPPDLLGRLLPCVGLGEGLADENGTEDDEREGSVSDRLGVPPPRGDVTGVNGGEEKEESPKVDGADDVEQMGAVTGDRPHQDDERNYQTNGSSPVHPADPNTPKRKATHGEKLQIRFFMTTPSRLCRPLDQPLRRRPGRGSRSGPGTRGFPRKDGHGIALRLSPPHGPSVLAF